MITKQILRYSYNNKCDLCNISSNIADKDVKFYKLIFNTLIEFQKSITICDD
jgi:hypothetical protein